MPKNYVLRHRVNSLSSPTLEAGTKFFSLSGKPVTFKKDSVLSASQGSYTLTGQNASLSTSTGLDSQAGDEAALESLNASLTGLGAGWSSNMSLSDSIDGVTVDTINSELRVTDIDLKNKGLTGNIEIANWDNLKQCTYVNFAFNSLNSQIPQGLIDLHQHSLEYLYLCMSDDVTDLIAEDPHIAAQSGSGDVHTGKDKGNEGNIWTGAFPTPTNTANSVLKWFILNWTDSAENTADGISSVPVELFDIKFEGLQIFNNNNIASMSFPDAIKDMTDIDNLALGIETSSNNSSFLTGSMPADFGTNLSSLRHLRLHQNESLSIDLDAVDFSGCTSLVTAAFKKTDIYGTVPSDFFDGTMPNLTGVIASLPTGSGISGAFPECSNPPDMHIFQFNNHNITSLPASLVQSYDKIIQFNLWDNQLTTLGTTDWTNQDRLRYIRAGGNELHENWPYVDWSADYIANDEIDQLDFSDNRYVFKHMLYVPPNAPAGETIFELYDALTLPDGWSYGNQKPFGSSNSYQTTAGSNLTIDDFDSIVTHVDNAYQWQKDGSNISGATNRSLTLSNIQSSDAGIYVLTVTNPGVPGLTLTSAQITVSV